MEGLTYIDYSLLILTYLEPSFVSIVDLVPNKVYFMVFGPMYIDSGDKTASVEAQISVRTPC